MKIQFSFLLLFFMFQTQAQEVSFSQPYSTPFHINPALVGAINAKNRLTVLYRQPEIANLNQGFSVSYDQRRALPNKDYVGLGFSLGDQDFNYFGKTYIKTGLSYGKYLGGTGHNDAHYLVAGTEGANQSNRIDLYKVLSLSGYPPTDPVGVISTSFIDFSMGATWFANWKKGRSAYVGFALHHINKPDITFFSLERELLQPRYTVNTGYEGRLNHQLRLVSTAIYTRQGVTKDVRLGLSVKLVAHDSLSFQLGAAVRTDNTSAINPSFSTYQRRNSVMLFVKVEYPRSVIYVTFDFGGQQAELGRVMELVYTYSWGELKNKSDRLPVW